MDDVLITAPALAVRHPAVAHLLDGYDEDTIFTVVNEDVARGQLMAWTTYASWTIFISAVLPEDEDGDPIVGAPLSIGSLSLSVQRVTMAV